MGEAKVETLPGWDSTDVDTVYSLEIPIIKVSMPGRPKMAFFAVPTGDDHGAEVVSYASMEALSPELRKLVSEELKKT